MNRRTIVATFLAAAVTAGVVAVPAHAASPHDPATQSSLRNLVTAVQSWSMFDNNDRYDGLNIAALADWGWRPTGMTYTEIVIEDDGRSWRATAQDTRAGGTEYTYALVSPVNGVTPGAVRASVPQPVALPPAAGATVIDIGKALDVDKLARALAAGTVTQKAVCEMSVLSPGSHYARSSVPDHALACEAALAAGTVTWRSLLAAMLRSGGRVALQQLALELLGDGSTPPAPPQPPTAPDAPPRPLPPTLPDNIWGIVRKADRLNAPALTRQEKVIAVEQCVMLAVRAGIDGIGRCTGETPIFLSGRSDVPEPTQHDLDALLSTPQWFSLNRQQPPHSRGWLDANPSCDGRQLGVKDCDEFPFAATRQGGFLADPPVSLRVLNAPQNQAQGRKLGQFYSTVWCDVRDGDEFFVVPLPERPGLPQQEQMPTLAWCDDAVLPVP